MCRHGCEVEMDVIIPAEQSCTGISRVKRIGVDACVAGIVDALNSHGIRMEFALENGEEDDESNTETTSGLGDCDPGGNDGGCCIRSDAIAVVKTEGDE